MYAPRETERDYLFTRGVLLLFLIFLAFGMAALSKSGGLLYAAIKAAPREVTGTITQVIDTRKQASPADIYYAFDYELGNRGQGVHSLNALVANPTYQIGDHADRLFRLVSELSQPEERIQLQTRGLLYFQRQLEPDRTVPLPAVLELQADGQVS